MFLIELMDSQLSPWESKLLLASEEFKSISNTIQQTPPTLSRTERLISWRPRKPEKVIKKNVQNPKYFSPPVIGNLSISPTRSTKPWQNSRPTNRKLFESTGKTCTMHNLETCGTCKEETHSSEPPSPDTTITPEPKSPTSDPLPQTDKNKKESSRPRKLLLNELRGYMMSSTGSRLRIRSKPNSGSTQLLLPASKGKRFILSSSRINQEEKMDSNLNQEPIFGTTWTLEGGIPSQKN